MNKKRIGLLILFSMPLVSAAAPSTSSLGSAVSSITKYGFWGVAALIGFILLVIIVAGVGYWQWQKKKWYLSVPLKMPRDNGRTVVSEIAKGNWDARKATLWVKRKGLWGAKFPLKLDDVRNYLQGAEVIELIGSGVNWKPILPESYLTVINEETGQEASIMKYTMDFTQDKHWAIQAERSLINTFSLSDFFSKIKDYIGWGMVIGITILAQGIAVYMTTHH